MLPLLAAAATAAIFVVDTLSPLGLAVAVLYSVVVLMAGGFCRRRGIKLVALGCAGLSLVSYAIGHGHEIPNESVVRLLVGLAALGVTTLLVLRYKASAEALRDQAKLLDLTHDMIFVRDMRDVVTYWSRGAEERYGWPRSEAVGQTAHTLLRTVFPAPLDEIQAELMATGHWEGELVHHLRSGRQITVASRWALQRDEHGLPVAVLETNTDITSRKHAEARAERQQRELKLALDTIPALVWRMAPNGHADYVNRRWIEYAGLESGAAAGWDWRSALHPEDRPDALARLATAFESGGPGEFEARLRRGDGDVRWFLFRIAPLLDGTGRIMDWYATAIDIEDRRQMEDSLRRIQGQLTDAQQLAQMGSFSIDVETRRVIMSDEAARICGYPPGHCPMIDEAIQRTHPDDVEVVRSSLLGMMSGGRALDIQHRLVRDDGRVRHVRVVGHRSVGASGNPEIVGALLDITEARQAEEALEQARADLARVTRLTTLGELTASIAHEVNQPLAAIVTHGEAGLRWLGRDEPDLTEVRRAVERMIGDGRRASEVVRRLRTLSHKGVAHHEPLALKEVLDEAIVLVQREIARHSVALRLDIEPDLPLADGDRIQLQQVIINLLVNGVQAMSSISDGARELTVGARRQDAEFLIVTVEDSGPGLPAEHAGRLFEAFFTTKADGMGMGLSICRSIVEAHGGRICAVPRGDKPGAAFHFTLPVRAEDAS